MVDWGEELPVRKRRVLEYGDATSIRQRLQDIGYSQEYLFPGKDEDEFKAYLEHHGVQTFL